MKILRTFTIVAALAGTAYAGDPAPAPTKQAPDASKPAAPKKELSPQETEKFIAFFNKFVDAVVATQDDCNKMSVAINALIDQNQPLIKRANAAKAEGKDLPQSAKDRMMARVTKDLMPAMQKCGADPKVQTAMKRMEAKPAAPAPTKTPAKTPPAAKK